MTDKELGQRWGWLIRREMEALWKSHDPELAEALDTDFNAVYVMLRDAVLAVAEQQNVQLTNGLTVGRLTREVVQGWISQAPA